MKLHKLSLRSAIFINLNIILGTGIFINSAKLAYHLGPWGAVSYATMGILLSPLILAIAQLVKLHKGGSFYDYAADIHPLVGFLSQWCYFVGKLAACTLGIHIFVSIIQSIFLPLKGIPTLALDGTVVMLFTLLNMLNLRINKSIQIGFFILKMIPIFFIIIAGMIFFSPHYITSTPLDLEQLFVSVPFALYAFTGFEATCSLMPTLENPESDGPKAILYSYGLSVCIAIAFQTLLYALVGPDLPLVDSFLETFPLVVNHIFNRAVVQKYTILLVHTALACSALGAAYGVMFSNAWNLFTLAQKQLLGKNSPATWLSLTNVPYICVLIQTIIIFMYLWHTQGAQVPLQQTNTLALTITFTLSVLGLMRYGIKHQAVRAHTSRTTLPLSILASFSCALLLAFLVKNFLYYQNLPSYPFVLLMIIGALLFLANFKQHQCA